MSSTLLEHARTLHEEITSHKRNIVDELLNPRTSEKGRVLQDSEVRTRLEEIKKDEEELIQFYEDEDESRSKELKRMSGRNALNSFYERLNDVRKYHQRFPSAKTDDPMEEESGPEVSVDIKFSGEEYYGLFVDMHVLYEKYLNVPSLCKTKIDYKTFLSSFVHFHNVEKHEKNDTYLRFLKEVLSYLTDFYQRKYPLFPVSEAVDKCIEEFQKKWEAKSVEGWQIPYSKEVLEKFPPPSQAKAEENAEEKLESQQPEEQSADANPEGTAEGSGAEEVDAEGSQPASASAEADASTASSSGTADSQEEKTSVEDDPFYCKACKKLFKEAVWQSHLKGRKHKKRVKALAELGESQQEVAQTEFLVQAFADLLGSVLEETRSYLDKKQTRTYEEIQKELEEREAEDVVEEEIEEDTDLYTGGVYNPKKIPKGWDGKPIPYWLYKFHGLDIERKCDICGGHSYWGPRAFNRHFREWRHANGMRILGLPNTKHFHNITKVEDAEALYKKLQERKATEAFNAAIEEEFEDNEGNVFGKQTYDALKRQRVI